MKIAIIHEMLIKLWGAEKVVENWIQLFPKADVFTLIYDEKSCGKIFPKEKIHPSCFLLPSQRLYQLTKKQRLSLPLMYKSAQKLDFSDYDILFISSSGFAHAIDKKLAKSIVYYHAPARYMWDWTHEYRKEIWMNKGIKGLIYGAFMKKLRMQDFQSAQNHDILLANSTTTQGRIWKYYRKKSEVLYPPIETERFAKTIPLKQKWNILKHISEWLSESQSSIGRVSWSDMLKIFQERNYYIILSALTEFKRLDIAIKNFKNIPETNLVIIGRWEQRENLEKLAWNTQNIFFTGPQFGDDLVSLVQNSLGLIFPGEEDFGIVPIEVMAAGKPVFALRKWGLTETVLEWKTGEFFKDSEGKDFTENFLQFHKNNLERKYSETDCKKRAEAYDKKVFEEKIQKYVNI